MILKIERTFFWTMTLIFMLLSTATSALGDTQNLPGKVAAVNDAVISDQDVAQKMIEIKKQFMQQGRPADDQMLASFKNQIIDNLIEEELLFQESRKKDIKIDQMILDKSLADIQSKFANEEEFLDALKNMALTKADLISKILRNLSTQELIGSQIEDKINIPETESQAFYNAHPEYFKTPEQVKASHILIKLEPEADEAARSAALVKIKDIQKQLKNGATFASLAQKFSEGPSNTSGGDLGYFGRGQMVKPFEDAVFALKSGETSDIVETQFGLHLIQLTDKKPEGTVDYKEAKEKISQHLKQERMKQDIDTYIQELKKNAKIEKF
ncbi:MAG: peptidylprolyl isomerase [Proteobacteria bacterium]|nr:peptidylprolyl isomerase [Pseudomonadota bacterium]